MKRRVRPARSLHRIVVPPADIRGHGGDQLHAQLRARIEELKEHLVTCASCSTCEATHLAWALDALLNEMEDAEPGTTWPAVEIRTILAEVLVW